MPEKDNRSLRVQYLKATRRALLKKLGLPPDTPPHEIQKWLEIKQLMGKISQVARNTETKK